MEKRRRKGREEIRVNWDNKQCSDWHYVPRKTVTLLSDNELGAGARVGLKWRRRLWTGTVAAKKAKLAASQQLMRIVKDTSCVKQNDNTEPGAGDSASREQGLGCDGPDLLCSGSPEPGVAPPEGPETGVAHTVSPENTCSEGPEPDASRPGSPEMDVVRPESPGTDAICPESTGTDVICPERSESGTARPENLGTDVNRPESPLSVPSSCTLSVLKARKRTVFLLRA